MIEEHWPCETRVRECRCGYAPCSGGSSEGDDNDAQQPSPEHCLCLHSNLSGGEESLARGVNI